MLGGSNRSPVTTPESDFLLACCNKKFVAKGLLLGKVGNSAKRAQVICGLQRVKSLRVKSGHSNAD
jgi:hypothetical protein